MTAIAADLKRAASEALSHADHIERRINPVVEHTISRNQKHP